MPTVASEVRFRLKEPRTELSNTTIGLRGPLALGVAKFLICPNTYATKIEFSIRRFCRAVILLKKIAQTYGQFRPIFSVC